MADLGKSTTVEIILYYLTGYCGIDLNHLQQ